MLDDVRSILNVRAQNEFFRCFNTAFNQALQDPEVKAKLAAQGADVRSGTPEQFAALVRSEMVRWGKVVQESGAKVD